jgi:4-carboxymuconolactone decarboxylase
MSARDARDARGQDTRRMCGGGPSTSAGSVPGAWAMAPDRERLLGEALCGTLGPREALSPRPRAMLTLSTRIVLARAPQGRRHRGHALHLGFPPAPRGALLIHDTWDGGAPAGLTARALCKAVCAERGIASPPPRVHAPTAAPACLCARGAQWRRQSLGDQAAARPAPPPEAERTFNRITGASYGGATWTRPGLARPSRGVCPMPCLAALGWAGPLRRPIRGALHLGLTQEQVLAVFLHLTLYGGIACARGAIEIANDVFLNG